MPSRLSHPDTPRIFVFLIEQLKLGQLIIEALGLLNRKSLSPVKHTHLLRLGLCVLSSSRTLGETGPSSAAGVLFLGFLEPREGSRCHLPQ